VDVSLDNEDDPFVDCVDEIREAGREEWARQGVEGVLAVMDKVTWFSDSYMGHFSGPDRPVRLSPEYEVAEVSLRRPFTYPQSGRRVMLSGVTAAPEEFSPLDVQDEVLRSIELGGLPDLLTAAHELGHALGFSHSGRQDPYDNPMDVMSGAPSGPTLGVGTIAINRYAAGWIDPEQVAIYPGSGVLRYRLSPPGDGGTQILVVRSGGTPYLTMGARVRKGFDSMIPKEGVETYVVDMLPADCGTVFILCVLSRRPTRGVIRPTIPVDLDDGLAHVMDVGGSFPTWNRVSVTIVDRVGDDFVVEVSDVRTTEGDTTRTHPGRFGDDDGNVHEASIELIAQVGITSGCGDAEDHKYCPAKQVTRAQMAVFVARALDQVPDDPPAASRFPDVPAGAWYLEHVERLADLGIIGVGSGEPFRPSDLITPAEMAVWMVHAFDSIDEVIPEGLFTYVPVDASYAAAVEGLYAAGVTTGCASQPPAYCPDQPVRRDQVASFLARALLTESDRNPTSQPGTESTVRFRPPTADQTHY